MKTLRSCLALMALLLSGPNYAGESSAMGVEVAPEIAAYFKSMKVKLTYVSTVTTPGCVSNHPDGIFKVISFNSSLDVDGLNKIGIVSNLEQCKAKLAGIYFEGRQDKDAVKKELGIKAASEMDPFSLTIVEGSNNPQIEVGCKLSKRYVAGSKDLRGQVTCSLKNKAYFDPQLGWINLKIIPE